MLDKIKAPQGANRKRKRVGRGESSGHGKTSCRGGKGQTARSGNSKPRVGFEGGQTPMYRRLPKRGFYNPEHKHFVAVNLDDLEKFFNDGELVDLNSLNHRGLGRVRISSSGVKILGNGTLTKRLTIKALAVSASAKTKIEAVGGIIDIG